MAFKIKGKELRERLASSRSGQAALEFLTTYGWAFLIILIMIGTLAYFGILSPSKLLPNRCNFGAEFGCADYRINSATATPANEFRLKLKNNVGEVVDPTLINLFKEDGSAYAGCTAAAGNTATGWAASATRELIWTACTGTGWVAGDKSKVLITVIYNKPGGYAQTVKGEVYSAVQ